MCRRKYVLTTSLFSLACTLTVLVGGCAHRQTAPKNIDSICKIFRQERDWYRSAYKSSKKWSVTIPVLMAIVHQESKFKAGAKPARTTCLCFFPGPRPSSAYGYAQAVDETWEKYKANTGNWRADRADFADAIDFVGWYCNMSYAICKIDRNDTYNLYLAYHEGHNGFNRRTYRKKAWLKKVAWKVQSQAKRYSRQLASCEDEFERPRPCCLWPF
jgi:hypothetical protein